LVGGEQRVNDVRDLQAIGGCRVLTGGFRALTKLIICLVEDQRIRHIGSAIRSCLEPSERYAVAETLAIAPAKLNDDRLGRTLDALAEHVDEVLNLIGRHAIERFGISTSELHWDLTDLRFTGSYAEQEEGFPQVKKGRTPERTIVRQVKAGHWVSGDGALPLTGRSFDGNHGDPNAVEPALAQLDALRQGLAAQQPAPLVVGDSKLLSAANVRAFQRRGLRFLCPHPKDAPLRQRLAGVAERDFEPLSYRPQRQKPDEPRYHAQEGTLELAGHTLRALFVLSLDDQQAARAQRQRHWTRLQEELDKLNNGVLAGSAACGRLREGVAGGLDARHTSRLLVEDAANGLL
jgi:hypothetical protein